MSAELCELLTKPCECLTADDRRRVMELLAELRAADAARSAARDPWRPAAPRRWPN